MNHATCLHRNHPKDPDDQHQRQSNSNTYGFMITTEHRVSPREFRLPNIALQIYPQDKFISKIIAHAFDKTQGEPCHNFVTTILLKSKIRLIRDGLSSFTASPTHVLPAVLHLPEYL